MPNGMCWCAADTLPLHWNHGAAAPPLPLKAVVRLPFPNVRAISAFVLRLLGSEDCHISAAERARNLSRPAVLLCHAEHQLALRMRPGAGHASEAAAAAGAAGATGAAEDGASATGSSEQEAAESHEGPAQGGSDLPAEGPAPAPAPAGSAAPAADAPASARDVSKAAEPAGPGDAGSQLPSPAPASSSSDAAAAPSHPATSLLPLLLPLPAAPKDAPEGGGEPGAEEEASGLVEPQPAGVEGVVAVAVDISGQHVHPFSPGLLPGRCCWSVQGCGWACLPACVSLLGWRLLMWAGLQHCWTCTGKPDVGGKCAQQGGVGSAACA